jgi:hypothetical protein
MKPTIYLGIGGTGNKALAHVKKHFEDEYGVGNIPSEVAFVGFDFQTDMDKDGTLATNISTDFITVDSNSNPKTMYQVQRDSGRFQWMPEINASNLDDRISKGAKQVRTTGRLYTDMTINQILPRITSVINRILHIGGTATTQEGVVDIYLITSLAGGSGAGAFISIATSIKEQYDNKVNLYGFGVMHGVFQAMDPAGVTMQNVMYNGVSSIIDLDYLFTASIENPIEFELGGKIVRRTSPIFDKFVLVDNVSESGNVLNEVDELCEMLGLCMYSYAGDAGVKSESVLNNIDHKTKNYDVKHKMGWVMSAGACQVVYNGQLLAEVYGLKAATALIRNLRQEGSDITATVLPWIQTVGLREDNINDENLPHDQLTDAICAPQDFNKIQSPLLDQAATDTANQQQCDKYLNNLSLFPTNQKLNAMLASFQAQLDEKVNTLLTQDGAVGNATQFVATFTTYCEAYKKEMDAEVATLTKKYTDQKVNFEQHAFKNYLDEKHGALMWRYKEKNQELLDDRVGAPARNLLKLSYEIKRREAASQIYNTLITYANTKLEDLEKLDKNLKLISKSIEQTLVQKQTQGNTLIFEYDLSQKERQNVKIDESEIQIHGLIESLNGKSLMDLNSEELLNAILAYTENLRQAALYKERLLSQVINDLPEEDYIDLKQEIEKRSARWLRVDDRAEVVNNEQNGIKSVSDAIAKQLIISYYPDGDNPFKLQNDSDFIKHILNPKNAFRETLKESAKQRMIVTRIDGCIIPYCIGSLDEITMTRYNNLINRHNAGQSVYNPHFDKLLFEKMQKADFKLKPDMQDEALFYWVCAQLFGVNIEETVRIMEKNPDGTTGKQLDKEKEMHTKLIVWTGGCYKMWDFEDQSWIQVGGGIKQRDVAYETFKIDFPRLRDAYKAKIYDQYHSQVTVWESKIKSLLPEDIKGDGSNAGGQGSLQDYIDRVVCSDKNSATYLASKSEYELIKKEYKYIREKLINELKLLKK